MLLLLSNVVFYMYSHVMQKKPLWYSTYGNYSLVECGKKYSKSEWVSPEKVARHGVPKLLIQFQSHMQVKMIHFHSKLLLNWQKRVGWNSFCKCIWLTPHRVCVKNADKQMF